MDIQQIKQTLLTSEYSFLRNNNILKNRTILLTTGGSHSYGTDIETSDLDIRGVCLESPENIIGLSNFEQYQHHTSDTTVYGLKKFMRLCLNANPNVIEILGTKDEHLFVCTEFGKILRDNIDMFISQKVVNSFTGYAFTQLRRLQNALARDSYPHEKKEQHILNSIQHSMLSLKEKYQTITNGFIKTYIDKSQKEEYDTEIFLDIELKNYPLRDFKNIYSDMHNIVKDYGKINHRNNKKDEPHLLKHSQHLVRLYLMGTEILEGKGVNTYREKDKELLLSIRKGEYSYEEIFEIAKGLENKFQYAIKNTSLPMNPDYNKTEEILMGIYKKYLLEVK